MLTYLTQLTQRIPAPVRQFWRTYGPLAVLLLSLLGLWLGHGERYIQRYVDMTTQLDESMKQRAGYAFGYTTAFILTRPLRAPAEALPWFGLLWSLGALTYRLAFRAPKLWDRYRGWQKSSPWTTLAVVAFALWFHIPHALDRWVGKNGVNDSVGMGIIACCVGYCLWMYFREARQVRRQLTETAMQAELTALKAQINPHFLFNSLNNIFGTALTEGGQRTPAGVQQLSGLLRYQLEKTQVEKVDVSTELRFLDDYVQFHRQLLPGAATLTHRYDWDERPATIAPLLLTPLVDYALQHQSDGSPQPLQSHLTVRDQFLHYQLTYPAQLGQPAADALDNLHQRLNTLYPEKHTLKEMTSGTTGKLDLTILLL